MYFSVDLIFSLTFLFIFHLLPLFSTQEFHPSSYTCPKDFQCGKLGNLNFPFTDIWQPYCGLCVVKCYADPLPSIKIDVLSEQWFSVQNMSENNFKLHDPILHNLLKAKSCYSFLYNIYLPRSPSISFVMASNITLFRCSKRLKQADVNYFRDYRRNESCERFDVYYKNPKSQSSNWDWKPHPTDCEPLMLPIRSYDNITDNTELFQFLSAEFDVEWHLSDECYDCHLKGGFCDQADGGKFRCTYAETRTGNKKLRIIIGAAAGGVLLVFVILAFCLKRKFPFCDCMDSWKSITDNQDLETFIKNYGSLAPKRYRYSDVKKMTNSFDTKLGQGGYGSVYKGKLQDGSLVAVKVLKESMGKGEDFINEVASISRTYHVNIVSLLGFCVQGQKKALIYEFMPNGSLEKFIYGESSSMNRQLEWQTLRKIAVGIARGLEYLHRGCSTRILHFDIKPHNILLDEDFCPKISDFGLAKLCTRKESIISTMAARGTIGYIAPEIVCKNIGGVSHKSDVYSYGMMLLEMIGGRKNVDVGVDHTSEIYFPHWIYTRLCQGDQELALSGIKDDEENQQARKMLKASLWCIQTNPSSRPTITEVLEMLEGPLEALQIPPKPFLYSPSRSS